MSVSVIANFFKTDSSIADFLVIYDMESISIELLEILGYGSKDEKLLSYGYIKIKVCLKNYFLS
jgi:hypothetical protein